MAISKTELESLIGQTTQPGGCVLSVYLDVDQSRASNLKHGYVRGLKEMVRCCEQRINGEQQKNFSATAQLVLDHVSKNSVRGRTQVLFADGRDFFWQRDLFVPIDPTLRWEEKPYVRPLVEAADEYERYGVVLTDREKARLFTVYLGEVEENRDIFSAEKRKDFKKTSKDTALSQPKLQRHEDEHALWHLKDVAAQMEKLEAAHGFDRLILAGPREITTELHGILSKKLQSLVVRSLPLASDATEQTVLNETMRIEEEVEREKESGLLERLVTAAMKESQGVLGLQATLDAMRLGRILQLVYLHDLTVEGSQCTKCGTLFAATPAACEFCDGELRPVPDLVARLADLVFESGGRAENVRGAASDRLRGEGGIGAFLRF
jgi:peptide chain release factor subunit 1